jgi:hypothetical protein
MATSIRNGSGIAPFSLISGPFGLCGRAGVRGWSSGPQMLHDVDEIVAGLFLTDTRGVLADSMLAKHVALQVTTIPQDGDRMVVRW